MPSIMMEEILKANGLDLENLHNPGITHGLAKDLRAKGYVPVTRKIKGKLKRVWTTDVNERRYDIKALLDKALPDVETPTEE